MESKSRQSGFTLIEVIVVIAVLALLAGIALPMLSSTTEDARVTKVLATIDQLKKACQRHKSDTRDYAVEYSGYKGDQHHRLSMKPSRTVTGWNGPYIDHVLSQADNPYESSVYVYNTLRSSGSFDLDGNGRGDASGDGNVVLFNNVDEDAARAINDAVDKGVPGTWNRSGRVKWSGNRLWVLLHYE